jgi:hypothetical protein
MPKTTEDVRADELWTELMESQEEVDAVNSSRWPDEYGDHDKPFERIVQRIDTRQREICEELLKLGWLVALDDNYMLYREKKRRDWDDLPF